MYCSRRRGRVCRNCQKQSALGTSGKKINDCPIPPQALDELVNLIESGKISGKQGKDVFAEMFASGKGAGAIVKEKGIEQLSDAGAIEAFCDQVMKLSKGKANPQLAGEILQRKLK